LKTSKISIGYYAQESAVRISTISKIGVTDTTNPCIEGTANCGENTICVASSEDSYDVSS
jgi:nidogen (entactin)